ncbi:unnamed protein product [Lampetra fluviatilis]
MLPLLAAVVVGGALLVLLLSGYAPSRVLSACTDTVYETRQLFRTLRMAARLASYARRRPTFTIVQRLLQQARERPRRPFVVCDGHATLTYEAAERESRRLAWLLKRRAGLVAGNTVALLVGNEPLFVLAWMALARIGCTAAFLNHNLRARSLLHCLSCSGATTLLAGHDMAELLEQVLPDARSSGVTAWFLGSSSPMPGVGALEGPDDAMRGPDPNGEADGGDPLPPLPEDSCEDVKMDSSFVYIYTSGTTGLPKAAIVNQLRFWRGAMLLEACGVTEHDVVYSPLPLYHSAASLIGIGGCINLGATLVLRKKFSASHFWSDCRKHDVTVVQYIGELLRYLCNQPKRPGESEHGVRMAVGNGLRQDVWQNFLDRFGPIRVCEFYAATEGNIGLLNHRGKPGAIGYIGLLSKIMFPLAVLRYDMEKEEPWRGPEGWCERVRPGEVGLLVGYVTPRSPFSGYAGNRSQSERKLLHGVFRRGDVYFNTGDLIRVEHDGYVYFSDRTGDTFRWKGENVATLEVADVLSLTEQVAEVNVYGVTVPGHEGRVGMAALVLRDGRSSLDGAALARHVVLHLPTYARPRFLRIQEELEMTGTMKQRKVRLVSEGFDPGSMHDPLYVLDDAEGAYVPLTSSVYHKLVTGAVKL